MRLTLVCHGATAATRQAAFPVDEPVESGGLDGVSAGGLGRIDVATRAPALCCAQTATAFGVAAEIEPLLRDCDYGDWAGMRLDEVAAATPDDLTRWLTDPDSAPHGGESVTDLIARVADWLDGQPTERRATVAVTHPSVIRAMLVHAIGAPPESFWRIDISPLSRTELTGGPGRWTLRWLTR